MAESTLHLTEASFDTELGKHNELMMVDFWAEWCAPCRALAPTLEELSVLVGDHLVASGLENALDHLELRHRVIHHHDLAHEVFLPG